MKCKRCSVDEDRIDGYCSEHCKEMAEAESRIAELEAAQHWIPVEERLPEKHECVLLLMKSKRYGVGVGIGHRLSSERHGWMVTYLPMPYDEITHWMPLPNLPEVNNG